MAESGASEHRDMRVVASRDDEQWRSHMLRAGTIVTVKPGQAPYAWVAVDGHVEELGPDRVRHPLRFFAEELAEV